MNKIRPVSCHLYLNNPQQITAEKQSNNNGKTDWAATLIR